LSIVVAAEIRKAVLRRQGRPPRSRAPG
jgi:hypothetical protein